MATKFGPEWDQVRAVVSKALGVTAAPDDPPAVQEYPRVVRLNLGDGVYINCLQRAGDLALGVSPLFISLPAVMMALGGLLVGGLPACFPLFWASSFGTEDDPERDAESEEFAHALRYRAASDPRQIHMSCDTSRYRPISAVLVYEDGSSKTVWGLERASDKKSLLLPRLGQLRYAALVLSANMLPEDTFEWSDAVEGGSYQV